MNMNDFLGFVDFLKNVDLYEERVKVLQDENTRLEDNIRLTSEIADIPRTKELTAQLLEEARTTLAKAKQDSADTREKAKTSYDKKLADVMLREAEAASVLASGNKAIQEANNLQLNLIAKLRKQESEVATKSALLETTQQEVAERLSKLKAVMG